MIFLSCCVWIPQISINTKIMGFISQISTLSVLFLQLIISISIFTIGLILLFLDKIQNSSNKCEHTIVDQKKPSFIADYLSEAHCFENRSSSSSSHYNKNIDPRLPSFIVDPDAAKYLCSSSSVALKPRRTLVLTLVILCIIMSIAMIYVVISYSNLSNKYRHNIQKHHAQSDLNSITLKVKQQNQRLENISQDIQKKEHQLQNANMRISQTNNKLDSLRNEYQSTLHKLNSLQQNHVKLESELKIKERELRIKRCEVQNAEYETKALIYTANAAGIEARYDLCIAQKNSGRANGALIGIVGAFLTGGTSLIITAAAGAGGSVIGGSGRQCINPRQDINRFIHNAQFYKKKITKCQ
jgi:Skp family chaperone for outer membrane proteins